MHTNKGVTKITDVCKPTFAFAKLSSKTTRKPSACFKLVTAFLFVILDRFDAQNCLGFWQKGSANKRTQLSCKFAVFICASVVSPLVIAAEWVQCDLGRQQTGIPVCFRTTHLTKAKIWKHICYQTKQSVAIIVRQNRLLCRHYASSFEGLDCIIIASANTQQNRKNIWSEQMACRTKWGNIHDTMIQSHFSFLPLCLAFRSELPGVVVNICPINSGIWQLSCRQVQHVFGRGM